MKNDGGPAFPVIVEGGEYSGLHPEFDSGMSLRDWFAGQILSGMYASDPHSWSMLKEEEEDRAQTAYSMADAMLEERKKENDSPG